MNKRIHGKFSGGFLYNPNTNSVLLHLRDGNTVYNPHMWAFFGGLNCGDETEKECFRREMREEIGLDIPANQILHLCDYYNTEFSTQCSIYYAISYAKMDDLILGEGAGLDWIHVSKMFDLKLTKVTKRYLKLFLNKIKNK